MENIKAKTIFLSTFLVPLWFWGCAAVGVPSTSDPYEKLAWAKELFDQQGRPIPAERLIHEAIDTCQKMKDSKCLAHAYFTYGSFFDSYGVKKSSGYYQKNGFKDKSATFENKSIKTQEYFQKAVLLDPKLYNDRGMYYYLKGQSGLAKADYETAISKSPKYRWPYVNLGVILHENDQYEEAISNYDKAIDLQPDFAKAYNNRGNSYREKGEYEKAITDYNKAISFDNEDVKTYINRGIAFFYMKHWDQAITDFESASLLIPQSPLPMIWIYLSEHYQGKSGKNKLLDSSKSLDLGRWPAPIVSLYLDQISPKDLLNKAPAAKDRWAAEDRCEAYFHIGQYFILKRDKTKASAMFRKIMAIDGCYYTESLARKELKRL